MVAGGDCFKLSVELGFGENLFLRDRQEVTLIRHEKRILSRPSKTHSHRRLVREFTYHENIAFLEFLERRHYL
jgi:hypothetical protein